MVNMAVYTDKYLFKLCMIITFTLAILFFSIIFSLHFTIKGDTESNCILKLDNEMLYDINRGIHSRSMAEKLMETYAKDNKKNANMRFLTSGLESCGPTFVFIDKSDNARYAVCENGKMYQYKRTCKN